MKFKHLMQHNQTLKKHIQSAVIDLDVVVQKSWYWPVIHQSYTAHTLFGNCFMVSTKYIVIKKLPLLNV